MQHYERVAIIGRWKPVHNGHAVVLKGLRECARRVVVGIGSANRYNWRSPFTCDETRAMVRSVLGRPDNVEMIDLEDLDNGPLWREMVTKRFGRMDVLFTANPYVRHLLAGDYRVEHPAVLVPNGKKVAIEGAMVRRMMARGERWGELVPPAVEDLIRSRGLDRRFRSEFGLETLAMDVMDAGRQHVLVE